MSDGQRSAVDWCELRGEGGRSVPGGSTGALVGVELAGRDGWWLPAAMYAGRVQGRLQPGAAPDVRH